MYNHINFFDLNKLGQNKNQLEKTNIEIVTPIEALSKGNMDKNLYNQFENYQPVLLNKNNPNDMLKAYNFILIDLQLYLDVHPEDENVKELFNEYVRRWHETKEKVQKINGPLYLASTADSQNLNWDWQKKWPFEGKMN